MKGNQNNLNIYYNKEKEGGGREVGIQDKKNQGEEKEVEGDVRQADENQRRPESNVTMENPGFLHVLSKRR